MLDYVLWYAKDSRRAEVSARSMSAEPIDGVRTAYDLSDGMTADVDAR